MGYQRRSTWGIISAQMLLTTLVSLGIMRMGAQELRRDQNTTLGLVLISSLLTIGTMCVFCCCPELMRKTPHNYIILFLFTLGESIVVGLVSSLYTTQSVIMAFGILTVVVFGLTVFACQ